jgi:hypothetical protein
MFERGVLLRWASAPLRRLLPFRGRGKNLNTYFFGTVVEWLLTVIAGIILEKSW